MRDGGGHAELLAMCFCSILSKTFTFGLKTTLMYEAPSTNQSHHVCKCTWGRGRWALFVLIQKDSHSYAFGLLLCKTLALPALRNAQGTLQRL